MAKAVKISSGDKTYTLLKRIEYILFGLLIFISGIFILYSPNKNAIYENISILRNVIGIIITVILLFNGIIILSGFLQLTFKFFDKKLGNNKRHALDYLILGIIGIVCIFVLYFVISIIANLFNADLTIYRSSKF